MEYLSLNHLEYIYGQYCVVSSILNHLLQYIAATPKNYDLDSLQVSMRCVIRGTYTEGRVVYSIENVFFSPSQVC
jgi:hypothetical protein